jgi:hypothetical protein
MTQSPDYARQIKEQSEHWSQHAGSQQKIVQTANGTIYEIPVVVHIIHTGGAVGTLYNPTDLQIQNWIAYCNQVYAAQSPLFVDTLNGGVSIPIRLVLAKRDPGCNATGGILRIDGSGIPNYTTDGMKDPTWGGAGVPETTIKTLSNWNSRSYYNIWIVTKINNGAVTGYATFPTSPPPLDGAVIQASITQPNFNASAILPHEIGHAFGLLHTFQGDGGGIACPTNTNCMVDGDEICDTEPHIGSQACPTGTNTCTGVAYNGVQFNFMSYTSCRNRFTQGQKDKMLFSLLNYRYYLLSSLGTTPPGNDPFVSQPISACTPTAIAQSNNFNVGPWNVGLADLFVSSQGYSGDGNVFYKDNSIGSCSQPQAIAHLKKDSTYSIVVTTGANPEYVRGWIDYNNDGIFSNTELVISSNGTLAGQTHSATFTIPPTGIVTCTPLRMRVASDLSGITPQPCSNPQYGQTEDFIVIISTLSPGISISAVPGTNVPNGTMVTFSAVTANGGSNPQYEWLKNGLAVPGISTATWTAIAGTDFVTGDVITARLLSTDLCVQPGSVTSNSLIMQATLTGMYQLQSEQAGLILYPNPNKGTFVVEGTLNYNGEGELTVTNALGQILYKQPVQIDKGTLHAKINLGEVPQGVYSLRFSANESLLKTLKFVRLN